jgi:regulator of sigma E protease
VLMNLLLALLVFWGMNYFQGKQVTKTTSIGYVEPQSPADSLGFKAGDRVLTINNTPVSNWEDLRSEIYINSLGSDVTVKLLRDNKEEVIVLPRNKIPEETEKPFLIPSGIKPSIQEVLSGSPAEKAGIKSGDTFLMLNNVPLFSSQQATDIISKNRGNELPLVVERKKDTVKLSVTPGADGLIGVRISNIFSGKVEYKTYGFFESFYLGWVDIIKMTDLTFSMLAKVFSGDIEFGKAFGGPVKIAQVAAKSADSGIVSFLYFLALLSLSLAIINIMPFPVLDGGHLIIILVEGIMKREIPVKVKVAIQNTGFVILLLLMAFIIYNDILNL